ncbi:hypothetical protein H7J86_25105 [Mycobacterium hackensackense]|uniref:hypothetical protein n=1 Tax=Mycobacterium hackensackense TaxID=228909 RepID=UPI002265CF0F|nr:hypothetical protein [Mycobacterium hackensackense]MCV7255446.1 hypothetical protein [Mycobacterium hackensackense]
MGWTGVETCSGASVAVAGALTDTAGAVVAADVVACELGGVESVSVSVSFLGFVVVVGASEEVVAFGDFLFGFGRWERFGVLPDSTTPDVLSGTEDSGLVVVGAVDDPDVSVPEPGADPLELSLLDDGALDEDSESDVSAHAGTAAIAEPIPSATASAPTRPTCFA